MRREPAAISPIADIVADIRAVKMVVLVDDVAHENGTSVRLHLLADLAYQEKLVRFIENHDEPRAAVTFSALQQRAAEDRDRPGRPRIHPQHAEKGPR